MKVEIPVLNLLFKRLFKIIFDSIIRPPKINFRFLVAACVASDPRVGIFSFLFCYETMSNCSLNCWIDWNYLVLCFKRLFHIRV